jgi:hypothetical protein
LNTCKFHTIILRVNNWYLLHCGMTLLVQGKRLQIPSITDCVQSFMNKNIGVVCDVGDSMYIARDLIVAQDSFGATAYWEGNQNDEFHSNFQRIFNHKERIILNQM